MKKPVKKQDHWDKLVAKAIASLTSSEVRKTLRQQREESDEARARQRRHGHNLSPNNRDRYYKTCAAAA